MKNEAIGYWHLCMDRLVGMLLFRDEEDYRMGMNVIPICLNMLGITEYCHALMSDHIHILAGGTYPQMKNLFHLIKYRMGRYIAWKYGRPRCLKDWDCEVFPLPNVAAFRNEVAYILRNEYVVGVNAPLNSLWNTGQLYFNPLLDAIHGTRVGDMRSKMAISILKTKTPVPDGYEIYNGIILPKCYVNYKKVEELFGTSIDFFHALRDWNRERDVEGAHDGKSYSAYSDLQLGKFLKSELDKLRVGTVQELSTTGLRQFIHLLHRKYGAGVNQIQRFTGADLDTILRFK